MTLLTKMMLRRCAAPWALLTAMALSAPAMAAECEIAKGAKASIEAFLSQAQEAHDAEQGTLSINDVLVGVTDIDDEDQDALDARELVALVKTDATHGTYESRGSKKLAIRGMFAGKETLFRIPKLAKGIYELTPAGATLTYDPDHTVEVGMSLIGIHVYKDVQREVITPERLAFFFAGNDGTEPDRCYLIKD